MNTTSRMLLQAAAVSVLVSAMGVAMAGCTTAGGQDAMQRESAQPIDDSWITAKVKTELLAAKDVSGLDLNVETVNGVVSLSGVVGTQAEADRAVSVAHNIKGVSRVDASGIQVRP